MYSLCMYIVDDEEANDDDDDGMAIEELIQ
jgi:hypothetical protein